jgi:hypothetical protein
MPDIDIDELAVRGRLVVSLRRVTDRALLPMDFSWWPGSFPAGVQRRIAHRICTGVFGLRCAEVGLGGLVYEVFVR